MRCPASEKDAAAFSIRHVRSVREVPDAALDALASSLCSSPAWLRFQETERADVSGSCLLAVAPGGAVAAALPAYRVASETNPNYVLQRAFPASGAGDGAQMLLGNRHGYDNTLLARPDLTPADRQAAFAQLAGAALELARREGVRTAWWPYLDHASMLALRPVLGGAVPVAMKNECVLTLPGTGFDDYLSALSRGRRAAVRADRARFAAAGYDVDGRRLSESVADIARLGVETISKHGGGLDVETARRMTAAQAALLDDVSTVLTCTSEGRTVGLSVLMDHGGTSYLRTTGLDYAETGSAAEYFELAYYRPIERAYSLGIGTFSLGVSAYRTKALRGALLRTRWALPLLVSAWPEHEARRHNAAFLRAIEDELGTLQRAIPYPNYDDYC